MNAFPTRKKKLNMKWKCANTRDQKLNDSNASEITRLWMGCAKEVG